MMEKFQIPEEWNEVKPKIEIKREILKSLNKITV